MKSHALIAGATLCLACASFGLACESDRERDGLRGPVHTITFQVSSEGPASPSPSPGQKVTVTYDRDGWQAEGAFTDTTGSVYSRNVYHRHGQDATVEMITLNPDGSTSGKTVTTFDPKRGEVTRKTYVGDTVAGWTVEAVSEDCRVENSISYYGDGQVRHKSDFKYDKDGRRIEAMDWDPHGPDETRVAFKYDSNDRIIQETSMNLDGSVRGITRFTYKLDSHGNWVKRSRQSCEPSPENHGALVCGARTTERRQITYYEDGR